MSNFLGFESYLIDIGGTPETTKTEIRNRLVAKGWQVWTESLAPVAVLGTLFTAVTYPLAAATNGESFAIGSTNPAASTAALPLWLGVQLAAPFTATHFYLSMGNTPTDCPKDFTIDYSDDGSSWTIAQSYTNEINWYSHEMRRFDISGTPGAHLYWRINVTAKNGTSYTTILEFSLRSDLTKQTVCNGYATGHTFLDVIPPSYETIGDGKFIEITRLDFKTTTIDITGFQYCIADAYPQSIAFYEKTAGAVQGAVTISGVTVTQDPATANAANTAKDNLRFTYQALRESVDANFLDWNWEYLPSKPGYDQINDYIWGTRKTITRLPITPTVNANINWGSTIEQPVTAGTYQRFGWNQTNANLIYSIAVDYTAGFIYYLSTFSRTFSLATKTNAGFYGPIYASYVDNTIARANTPIYRYCTPIELCWGQMGQARGTQDTRSNYKNTHSYGIALFAVAGVFVGITTANDWSTHPFCQGHMYAIPGDRTTFSSRAGSYNFFVTHEITCLGGPSSAAGDLGILVDNYPVVGMGRSLGFWEWANQMTMFWVPGFRNDDIFKRQKANTNETLVLVADTRASQTAYNSSDMVTMYSTFTVSDPAFFPLAGTFILNDEIWTYTGKSGNTLTGVTRAAYGSVKNKSYVGDKIFLGGWFVTMNDAQMFAGYAKPS